MSNVNTLWKVSSTGNGSVFNLFFFFFTHSFWSAGWYFVSATALFLLSFGLILLQWIVARFYCEVFFFFWGWMTLIIVVVGLFLGNNIIPSASFVMLSG